MIADTLLLIQETNGVYLNDGHEQFNRWDLASRTGSHGADLDGDVDILQRESNIGFRTLLNDGTGRFRESDISLPLTRHVTMAMRDLNGDDYLDVFLNNFGLPSAVWLNDGEGGLFDSGMILPGEWLNASCPMGDLDGDGDLDVSIAAFGSGPNEAWFNDE